MTGLREVIVVDGDDNSLHHTRAVLVAAQAAEAVHLFATAQAALDFLQRAEGHDVDLVMLAVDGPEAFGRDFLRAHERLHESQRARLIVPMIGAASGTADAIEALGAGCAKRALLKPLNTEQVRQLVLAASQTPSWR